MKSLCTFFICLLTCFNFYTQPNYTPCASSTPIHIVVLGSSTAAGSGPSSSDSTWVNRYRKHIVSINSANQVTNLGVGGTTTYNIMPDWYVSPSGKPSRDITKNISEAIRLGADAVIINMPSNDAANGFSATEQLFNFRTIQQVADSFNILLWVCTTQPRNGFNASRIQTQLDVRDSVMVQYGAKAIDFWSGFANSSNGVDSTYDSGDGVHLNDRAHGILAQRVINELIPNELSDTLSYLDLKIEGIAYSSNSCGDSLDNISVDVVNMGVTTLAAASLKFELINLVNNQTSIRSIIIPGGLNSCTKITLNTQLNTYLGADYQIRAYLDSVDINTSNDTTALAFLNREGHPSIVASDIIYCFQDTISLQSTASVSDSVIWYDSLQSTSPIHIGQRYTFYPSSINETKYLEAVRGPLHFKNEIVLNPLPDVNWNGYMFDLVPKDSIVIDSLSIPINTTGNQKIAIYRRKGSHQGVENNMAKWTYIGKDSAMISASGELLSVQLNSWSLTPNDTFSIYIHLENASSNLSYKRATTPSVQSDSKLDIPSGSSIVYTFGTTYYPRNFSGIVHYHYGFNPKGSCQSNRVAVQAIQSQPYLSLGNDTTISISDSIVLTLGNSFISNTWSNGSTQNSLVVNFQNFGIGLHTLSVSAIDTNGCLNKDTITIEIQSGLGVVDLINSQLKISPNPSSGVLQLKGLKGNTYRLLLIQSTGKVVVDELYDANQLNFSQLPKGVYQLVIQQGKSRFYKKLVLY